MDDTIVIVVPLPAKQLSQNARVHWRAKSRHTQQAKAEARWATVNVRYGRDYGFPWHRASIHMAWYWRDKRSMCDDDNLIGRAKATRDGIAAAGVVTDDKVFELSRPEQFVDKDDPRLVVTIRRITILEPEEGE